jgi:hypothetical protein
LGWESGNGSWRAENIAEISGFDSALWMIEIPCDVFRKSATA